MKGMTRWNNESVEKMERQAERGKNSNRCELDPPVCKNAQEGVFPIPPTQSVQTGIQESKR